MGRILFWVILIVAIYAAFVFARSRRTKGNSHKQVDGKKSKFPTKLRRHSRSWKSMKRK